LTIAGSDSGGGAGIQADLKTFAFHGVFGMSAITALTAQNTLGVSGIFAVAPAFVQEQITAVVTDIGVDATKTGMLATSAIVDAVAESVVEHRLVPLVVDPVFVAKGGDALLAEDAVDSLKQKLIPLATIVTPNIPEAEVLTGMKIGGTEAMAAAAEAIVAMGAGAALVKGGHLGGDRSTDVLVVGGDFVVLDAARHRTDDTHGTGCVLSSSITAHLAHGEDLQSAVQAAKVFVEGAIENGLRLGSGHGPADPSWRSGG
jgi:hydroxymethylpyrimidine/phosphomethylpyrimidine kinase